MSGPSPSPPSTSPSAWPFPSCLSSSRRRGRLCKWNRPGSPLVFLLEAALCVALVLSAYSAVRHRRRTSTDVQEVEEGQEDVKCEKKIFFSSSRVLCILLAPSPHVPFRQGGKGTLDTSLRPGGGVWGRYAPTWFCTERGSNPGPPALSDKLYAKNIIT